MAPTPGSPGAGRPRKPSTIRPGNRGKVADSLVPAAALPVVAVDEIPPAPDTLTETGVSLWRDIFSGLGVVANPLLDRTTVSRFVDLITERTMWADALDERGVLLEEPIQNARGDVLEGVRVVANPAARELRRLDTALDHMIAQLALSPTARAKLGLTVSAARVNESAVDSLMSALPKRIRREQKGPF
jgi:P27 family predicted phage terminase small subunit